MAGFRRGRGILIAMKTFVIVVIAVAGLLIAMLGLAAALDIISLRALAAETDIERFRLTVEHARALFSHRKAQGLELAAGLSGLGLLALSGALLTRYRHWSSRQLK
jgi:hypothetical protein